MNTTFARWRHLTTTTRVHLVFPFYLKFCNLSEVELTMILIFISKQTNGRILVVVVK